MNEWMNGRIRMRITNVVNQYKLKMHEWNQATLLYSFTKFMEILTCMMYRDTGILKGLS
jgi:hypothetical protein